MTDTPSETQRDARKPWLTSRAGIRTLWAVGLLMLAASVAADPFVKAYGHFEIDGSFAFYAWYGLATCAAMVIGAKLLGMPIKRRDNYYARRADAAETEQERPQ